MYSKKKLHRKKVVVSISFGRNTQAWFSRLLYFKDIFPEVHVLAASYDFISSVIYFFPLKYFSIKKTL